MSINSISDVERVLAEDDALHRDERCPAAKRQRELAAQARRKPNGEPVESVTRAWDARLDRLEQASRRLPKPPNGGRRF